MAHLSQSDMQINGKVPTAEAEEHTALSNWNSNGEERLVCKPSFISMTRGTYNFGTAAQKAGPASVLSFLSDSFPDRILGRVFLATAWQICYSFILGEKKTARRIQLPTASVLARADEEVVSARRGSW